MLRQLIGTLTLLIAFSGVMACQGEGNSEITPSEAQKMIQSDSTLVLLDVRTLAEFHGDTGHLAGAKLIPVQELEQRINELSEYQHRTILVYCRTGHRSTAAAQILRNHKFNVFNMTGGIARWRSEDLPIVKEPN